MRSFATPFQQTIHVDLEAGRYCTAACLVAHRIDRSEQGIIIFRDRPSDGYNLVDRASWFPHTGQYVAEFAATYRAFYESRTKALCTRSALAAPIPGESATGELESLMPNPRGELHFAQPSSAQQ